MCRSLHNIPFEMPTVIKYDFKDVGDRFTFSRARHRPRSMSVRNRKKKKNPKRKQKKTTRPIGENRPRTSEVSTHDNREWKISRRQRRARQTRGDDGRRRRRRRRYRPETTTRCRRWDRQPDGSGGGGGGAPAAHFVISSGGGHLPRPLSGCLPLSRRTVARASGGIGGRAGGEGVLDGRRRGSEEVTGV